MTRNDTAEPGAPVRRRWFGTVRLVLLVVLLTVAAGVLVVVRVVPGPGPLRVADEPRATTSTRPSAGTSSPMTTNATQPATTTAPAPPAFDRGRLSITDPASSWVVVDKARPLTPLDYAPSDLVPIGGGYRLRAETAQAMGAMLAAAAAEGLTITVQSAYRSYDHQLGTFGNQVARFGQAQAEIQVARPGYSEHQTGLAADVGGGGCDIESCFADTAEGRWVAVNGPRFGFIVRYPDGKQDVTGFKYEPWHVRYVGAALATELQRTGIPTLEEFFGLPAAPRYTS